MADLKAYFQKIKALENVITEPFAIVASVATSDGGKAGVLTEVTRHQAARLVVDGRARLANEEEVEQFRADALRTIEEQEKRVRNESMRLALLASAILKDHGLTEEED